MKEYNTKEEIFKKRKHAYFLLVMHIVLDIIFYISFLWIDSVLLLPSFLILIGCTVIWSSDVRYWDLKYFILYGGKHE